MFNHLRPLATLSAMLVLALLTGLNPLANAPTAEAAPMTSGISATSPASAISIAPVAKKATKTVKATKTAKAKSKVKVKIKRKVTVSVTVGTASASASSTKSASATKTSTVKSKASAKAKTKAAAKKAAAAKAKVKAKKAATKKAKAAAKKAATKKATTAAKTAATKSAKAKAKKLDAKKKEAAQKDQGSNKPAPNTDQASTSKPAANAGSSSTSGQKPGAKNTGVPAGVKLKKHTGDITVTKAGTVIDGLDIHGYVRVKAKNVTIRNSIIRGGNDPKPYALVRSDTVGASLTIEDSELVAANPSPFIDGLRGFDITARRLNIHGVIDGAHFYGDNVLLENSWIHDNLHYKDDPYHSDGSHDDGIQVVKGNNVTIRNNNIQGAFNAAIMITQDSGSVSKLAINSNWLDGGKCTLNLSRKSLGPLTSVTIKDNLFGRNVTNPKGDDCAITYAKSTDGGMLLQNNLYADNLKAAKVYIDKNR